MGCQEKPMAAVDLRHRQLPWREGLSPQQLPALSEGRELTSAGASCFTMPGPASGSPAQLGHHKVCLLSRAPCRFPEALLQPTASSAGPASFTPHWRPPVSTPCQPNMRQGSRHGSLLNHMGSLKKESKVRIGDWKLQSSGHCYHPMSGGVES